MATTLGDLLDAHADLLPIPLLIDKLLHQVVLRFATLPPTHPLYKAVENAAKCHVKRHPTPLHYLMNNYSGLKPHLMETIKPVRMTSGWTPKLATQIADSKDKAKEEDEAERARIRVYLDGSGIGGKIGAAVVLYKDGRLKGTRRLQLGSDKHHMVYEGEGIGMILGLQLIREEQEEINGMVPMGVDNQAAIMATSNIQPGPSHHIWDTFHQQLNATLHAHSRLDLPVCWTLGHVNIVGNERADEEAKKAAENGSSPKNRLPRSLQKPLPKSKSAVWQTYHRKLKCTAIKQWQQSPCYHHMKAIDPTLPSSAFCKFTAELSRKQAALLIQLRSGHVSLAKHLHHIGKTESPVCPCC